MDLPFPVIAMALGAAVLHAGWNGLVKAGRDRMLTMTLVIGVGVVAAAPLLPFVPVPAAESWVYLILSAAILSVISRGCF